jgi:hypothetical protein
MHESISSATNVYVISETAHKHCKAKFGSQIQFNTHSVLHHFNFQVIYFNFMDIYIYILVFSMLSMYRVYSARVIM